MSMLLEEGWGRLKALSTILWVKLACFSPMFCVWVSCKWPYRPPINLSLNINLPICWLRALELFYRCLLMRSGICSLLCGCTLLVNFSLRKVCLVRFVCVVFFFFLQVPGKDHCSAVSWDAGDPCCQGNRLELKRSDGPQCFVNVSWMSIEWLMFWKSRKGDVSAPQLWVEESAVGRKAGSCEMKAESERTRLQTELAGSWRYSLQGCTNCCLGILGL